jgi:hypothetical protein
LYHLATITFTVEKMLLQKFRFGYI